VALPDGYVQTGAGAKIVVMPDLGFRRCELILAIPEGWLDIASMADLADLSVDFKRTGRSLRVATKFPNLTRDFLHQHGVNYFYVTRDDFESLVAADGFVEHAQFGSNRYGTSKQTIAEQTAKGLVVVLDIEIEGVKQVRQSDLTPRYVFILPPSLQELERRLRGRGTETEENIQKRLDRAQEEIAFAEEGGFDKLIVNTDIETAYRELESWIYGESG
jgi:guanylate kinase